MGGWWLFPNPQPEVTEGVSITLKKSYTMKIFTANNENRELFHLTFINWILCEMVDARYIAPGVVFVDGTHIKANANTKKTVKVEVPLEAKRYVEELMEEVNADREAHGKKPFDSDEDDNEPPAASGKKKRDNTSKKKLKRRKKAGKSRTVVKSTTDPDCGLFVKGEHQKQLAYEAHTACDSHGVILAVEVTPGRNWRTPSLFDVFNLFSMLFCDIERNPSHA